MMLKNAEKPDFSNARALEVCQKMMTGSVRKQKKPYFYGILRKTGHGMDFS
jgi:hypothetical protein